MTRSTLTTARAGPIFKATATVASGPSVALVSITVTARAIVFTDARCVRCNRRIMSIPGLQNIEVRAIASDDDRSGRGRCVACSRCRTLNEIIEHGAKP